MSAPNTTSATPRPVPGTELPPPSEEGRPQLPPMGEHSTKALDLIFEKGGLADDVRELLLTIGPPLAEAQSTVNAMKMALVTGQLTEDYDDTRLSFGVLENRLHTMLANLRTIEVASADLAKVARDFLREAQGTADRASARGYQRPDTPAKGS